MTDLKRLKTFLNDAGIEYSEEKYTKKNRIKKRLICEERVRITCKEGDKGIGGYDEFFTDFEFDIKGKFIIMGAWE